MAYNYHVASLLIPITVLAVACTVLGLIVYYNNKQKVDIYTMVAREQDRMKKRRKKRDEEKVFEEKAMKSMKEVEINIVDCESKNSYEESSSIDIEALKSQVAEEQQTSDSKKTRNLEGKSKTVVTKGNLTKSAKPLTESSRTKTLKK